MILRIGDINKKAVRFGVKQHLIAFNKATGFISARIEQVTEITKPQKKFLNWLFEKWVMLPVLTIHNYK